MEGFRAKYHIPQGVGLQYCAPDQVLIDRGEGEVVVGKSGFVSHTKHTAEATYIDLFHS